MMRRSRISVRPNFRPGARSVTSSQDGQPSPAAGDSNPTTKSEEVQLATVKMTKTRDKPAASEQQLDNTETKETGQSGSDSSSSLLQRRKRFSAMPNLAKTRVSIASARMAIRVPKSPPPKVSNPLPADTAVQTPSDNSTAPNIRSPRWRRASGSGKLPRMQSELGSLSPSALAAAKQAPPPSTAPAASPTVQGSGEKEASSSRQADLEKFSPEEKPRTDPSSVSVVPSQRATADVKSSSSLPTAVQSITSEKEKIAKLREILKQERRKLKRYKKGKSNFCEHSVSQDHNKMTMRDLIYYLPESNPMKSYPAEETELAEKVLPSSPDKVLPEKPQEVRREDEEQVAEEGRQGDEPADDDQLVVPRVKVAEDGTLILDEESLTVEVSRTKGPNLAEENDPIFERGSSTTYSSFRKSFYAKPWSIKETEMFFLAISMVGTDFSLIGQLFPHRARTEIKNKYKKEERENSVRVDKAFREKRRFDLECFTKLLKQILAEEKDRKKSKIKDSVGQKKKARTRKGRKAASKGGSGDQSSEEELDSDVVEGDSEMAEKENEDCSNVVESRANLSPVNLTCKRKSLEDEETLHGKSAHARSLKKSRTEDEGALAEDCDSPICGAPPTVPDVDRLKKPEGSRPSRVQPEIKPALLSRGRFLRPTPNLGTRSAKKTSQTGEKSGDVESCSSQGDEVTARQEQNTTKPPREGQRPPEKEELASESSSASPESPKGDDARGQARQQAGAGRRPKARPNLAAAQRNARRGKSKLVTLRASVPDDEEDELDEAHLEEEDFGYNVNPEEQNQVPAFVPVSLRSPQPVPMEVEETVEELEISMNMCDVVDSAESEAALCVQAVCSAAQDELALSTEHHLDLLVDVIEFLSSDSVDGSEESYNEAARTLLTIRNPELLSLAARVHNREVVITEEPHHVPLDETEPDENSTAGSTDHLENGSEEPQRLSTGVSAPEISQSAAQPACDRHSTSVTPVEEVKPESMRAETASPSCESSIMGDTAVSEESHGQERAEPASSGDANDGVLRPKPSLLTVQLGRRSRFPKPKPNLARTARTSRVTSTQCAGEPEGSAAAGPVELEPLKTAQVVGRTMDRFPGNQVQERRQGQGSGQTGDSCVGGSLGECTGPELSKQGLLRAGRARRFPKCRPVLGVAEWDTSVSAAPATDGESRSSGIRKADRLTEDETSASRGTGMRVEADKDEGTALPENQLSEEQAEMNVFLETGETNADNSIAVVKEKCPEDEVQKSHQTSVRTNQQEADGIHLEDDLGATVTCQTTEDQKPSLILTLFEVSPPLLEELDSAADPPSAISEELLSPLVFADEQLPTSFAQTEPYCCDPLNATSVEMEAEKVQGSHQLNTVSVEMEAEKGRGSRQLNTVSEEMEAEKGRGSRRLNTVSEEMEAEKGRGSRQLNAVSVEMEAEKGRGSRQLNAVSEEMEAEKGRGSHQLNAVSVEMEAEKGRGSRQLNTVSVEMEAEKVQGSHQLNTVSEEMEAEKGRGSHQLNAVSEEMEAEKGRGSRQLNAVSVEMEAEKGRGSRQLNAVSVEMEAEKGRGSRQLNAVSVEMEAEKGRGSRQLNTVSEEMEAEKGRRSRQLNTVSVEMEAEKGRGSRQLNAVSVEMEAEKGRGSRQLNTVSEEMEAEKGRGSRQLNTVSVEMEAEKGRGSRQLNAVSVEMEAEKGRGSRQLNTVSEEMEAEKGRRSHQLNAVSVEMEAEKGRGSHQLNTVSEEMEAEKGRGSRQLNAVSVEMEAEKGRGSRQLNKVSVEMEAEKGRGSRTLAPAYGEQEEQHDHGSKLGGTESTMDVSSNTVASPVNSCGDGLLKSHSSALHPEDSPEDVQTVSKTPHPLPCTDQQSPQATLLHSIALQHSCTQPEPSASESPEYFVLPVVDMGSSSNSKCAENSTAGSEPHASQRAVPVTSGGPTTRTGRKPRGFLSFISDKGTARPASAPRSARPACLRPQVNTARPGRRAPAASALPSGASAANAQAADNGEPAANSQTAATIATDQVSTSAHEESLSLRNSRAAEEPTSVSEFFFSDIFTQVEEPE